MRLCRWEQLPEFLRRAEVRPYYDSLCRKKNLLRLKRCFDLTGAVLLLLLLWPVGLVAGLAVHLEDGGPVFFRQTRLTQYGREFAILKLRTMTQPPAGGPPRGTSPLCTPQGDRRITAVGRTLRRLRLDEIPQLWNILWGEMSFVGVRPEVPRYAAAYTCAMAATLLLPAGLTSPASVAFRDEDERLAESTDPEAYYIKELLPRKMALNLEYLEGLSLGGDLRCLWGTVTAVLFSSKRS